MTTTKFVATCSYAEYQREMGMPIRISRTVRGIKIRPEARILELTPGRSYYSADPETFEAEYMKQLDRFGLDHIACVLTGLITIGQGRRPVLLCYEDLSTAPYGCHRRIFARWWKEQTGDEIPELGRVR